MEDVKSLLKPHMIAFIDFMGTSKITEDDKRKYQLLEVLLSVHKEVRQEGKVVQLSEHMVNIEPSITSFSDCIAISVPLSKSANGGFNWDAALLVIQQRIARLFDLALQNSFLIRGSIEIGELYHAEHMVYGKALVDAYLNEQKSVYPRITITDNCLAKRREYSTDFHFPQHLNQVQNLEVLGYDNLAVNSAFHIHKDAKIFLDYDETLCLRMINIFGYWTQEWRKVLHLSLIEFKKSAHEGIIAHENEAHLKKNWVWLKRYLENEESSLNNYEAGLSKRTSN